MEMPEGLFRNHAKRYRWGSLNSEPHQDETEDSIRVPHELQECLNKISQSPYMRDFSSIKRAQIENIPLYSLATAYNQPNYFWLQYSMTSSKEADSAYVAIVKSINNPRHRSRLNYNEVTNGLVCNAQYKDGSWYRALVIQATGFDYFKVLYPDYGNTETLPLEDLAKTTPGQFSAPLQSFCACLYNIRPKHQSLWTEIGTRLKKFFDNHIHDDLIVKVKFVRKDYIVDCDIFYVKGKTKETTGDILYRKHIAQDLVDEGLAYFIDQKAAHSLKKRDITTIDEDMAMDSSDEPEMGTPSNKAESEAKSGSGVKKEIPIKVQFPGKSEFSSKMQFPGKTEFPTTNSKTEFQVKTPFFAKTTFFAKTEYPVKAEASIKAEPPSPFKASVSKISVGMDIHKNEDVPMKQEPGAKSFKQFNFIKAEPLAGGSDTKIKIVKEEKF